MTPNPEVLSARGATSLALPGLVARTLHPACDANDSRIVNGEVDRLRPIGKSIRRFGTNPPVPERIASHEEGPLRSGSSDCSNGSYGLQPTRGTASSPCCVRSPDHSAHDHARHDRADHDAYHRAHTGTHDQTHIFNWRRGPISGTAISTFDSAPEDVTGCARSFLARWST